METISGKIRDIVSDEFDNYTLFCNKPGVYIATEKVATEVLATILLMVALC